VALIKGAWLRHVNSTRNNFRRLRQSIAGEKSDGHAVFNFYTFPYWTVDETYDACIEVLKSFKGNNSCSVILYLQKPGGIT